MKSIDIDMDSLDARCSGLKSGMAVQASKSTEVPAERVDKNDGPFYCPKCLSEAIVRKCSDKIDHFAHVARVSPIVTKKNQQLHNQCRDEIYEFLKSNFPNGNWDIERPIPIKLSKDWNKVIIPDISGRLGDKSSRPIAIEIQKTPYTIKRIHDKTVEYTKRGVYVLWIVPLAKELGNEPFRPRLYEKYLHSMYYGRVYYWVPEKSPLIIPIHYGPTMRWIEEKPWFDVNTSEDRVSGGFFLKYKTIMNPIYGNVVNLSEDLIFDDRPKFVPKNQSKEIPQCKICKDNMPAWWSKEEESLELNKQEIHQRGFDFLKDYDFDDDYDE